MATSNQPLRIIPDDRLRISTPSALAYHLQTIADRLMKLGIGPDAAAIACPHPKSRLDSTSIALCGDYQLLLCDECRRLLAPNIPHAEGQPA